MWYTKWFKFSYVQMLVSSILKHVNTILLNTLPKLNWEKKEFLLPENKQSNKQKNPKLSQKNGTHGSNNKQNRHLDKGKDKTIMRAVHRITNHVKEPEQYRWVD